MLQLETLYDHLQKAKHKDYVIQASFHGIQIKDLDGKITERKVQEDPKVPMFRDPKEYEEMSETERIKETQRMMDLHKRWSGDAFNKAPKV